MARKEVEIMDKKILVLAIMPIFILSSIIVVQASGKAFSSGDDPSDGTKREKTYGTSSDMKIYGTSTDEKIFGTSTPTTTIPNFRNFGTFKRNFSTDLDFRATTTDMDATGTARIIVNFNRDGLYTVNIRETLRNLSTSSSDVFESWLVDDETGYGLSLGAFKANSRGRAAHTFNQRMTNFPAYDRLVVSRETLNDTDPRPDETVLEADIPATLTEFHMRASLSTEGCAGTSTPGDTGTSTATSSLSGTGRFIVDMEDNTIGYDLRLNGLEATGTTITIHGPAKEGSDADALLTLPQATSTAGSMTGVLRYDESMENHFLGGKSYLIVSTDSADCALRGQLKP